MRNSRGAAIALALVAHITCGNPSRDDALAEKLLTDARAAKHEERFDAARLYLERALDNAPEGSSLREEILFEKDFRLPLDEAHDYLRARDPRGVAKTLEQLEAFVRDHPGRLREARELDDVRRSARMLGPSSENATGEKHLNDARKAKHEQRFDTARTFLDRALENAPDGSALRDEILYERDFRLPLVEAYHYLQAHEPRALARKLQELETFAGDHPERLRESREIDDLRRSAGALEQALTLQTRLYLKELEFVLENEYAMVGEYPDADGFAELLKSWEGRRVLSLDSYARTETGYEAVFVELSTGARVTFEPRKTW